MKSSSNRAGHPNSYTDPDEIGALKRRLTIHRRSLYVLEERRAKYGDLDVPLHIIHEIAEEKENIAQIKARLEELEGGTPVPHHIDGKTQVMESGGERGVAVDEAMEKPAPSLGYFFAALLALDLILVFVLGWHLFGDQPLLLSYLEVVTGILGIGLEIALLTVAIQRKWSITEILRWLGTSKPWQATILIVTVDLLVVVLWPQVIEVISSVEEPLPPPTQFSYQVWVQAGDTGEYIQDAVVTIEVEGQAPLDGIADSNGVARIFISSDHAGQPGFLLVEAKGYKRYTQHIDVTMDALPDVVLLERSLGVTPTPTFTPTPHIGPSTAPTLTLTPITTNTSTSTPTFTHTPTRAETPTDTPVFTCTPTQAPIPTAIPTTTDTPTLAPTQTLSYTIEFRASKTIVNPGEWVIFRWHVENVRAVYLDWKGGAGAPGDGWDSRPIWETTDHTLRVVLQNGETITRTITVNVRE